MNPNIHNHMYAHRLSNIEKREPPEFTTFTYRFLTKSNCLAISKILQKTHISNLALSLLDSRNYFLFLIRASMTAGDLFTCLEENL